MPNIPIYLDLLAMTSITQPSLSRAIICKALTEVNTPDLDLNQHWPQTFVIRRARHHQHQSSDKVKCKVKTKDNTYDAIFNQRPLNSVQ